MNKKNLSITIVLLVISILVVGCGPGSEQTTPSPTATDIPEPSPTATDLPSFPIIHVGHWGRFPPRIDDPSHEVYFGEPDEKGMGSGFMRVGDESFYFSYKIVSVDGDTLTLDVAEKGAPDVWQDYVEIAEDGKSMKFQRMTLVYLDSKTEP